MACDESEGQTLEIAPGGGLSLAPPGAIYRYFRARWHFEIPDGRDFPAKVRPVAAFSWLHRARYQNQSCKFICQARMNMASIQGQ